VARERLRLAGHRALILSRVSFPAPRAARGAARAARLLGAHVLLVAFGAAAAALIGELALRVAFGHALWPPLLPEPYVDNERLYRVSETRRYELKPGADDVVGRDHVRIRVNAAGLRDDREYAVPKPPGVRRLVVLGDSFTFAGKVALEETFPKRLEKRLRQATHGQPYEVLNLAVPGYNSRQQALLLEERGLAFQPDLVIVAFVLNDALPAGQLVPLDARLPLGLRRFLKRFALVQFVAGGAKRLPAILAGNRFKGGSEAALLAEGSSDWRAVQEALERIDALARAHEAGLLVTIWPMLERLEDYPFGAQHALVAGFCRERGIAVVDPLPAFRQGRTEDYWVARDDHHPNALAQRVVGDAIFEALRRGGLEQPAGDASGAAAERLLDQRHDAAGAR
jgi:lysophospholipase L1-like esterase